MHGCDSKCHYAAIWFSAFVCSQNISEVCQIYEMLERFLFGMCENEFYNSHAHIF